MGIKLHNPLPGSLKDECKKTAKILQKFVGAQGSKYVIERPIPPEILHRAKGLAILTVAKVAFLGSGRAGSGVLIARLPNGSWSAPSAIGTVGLGGGFQVGLELTDFVFVLNDDAAVRTLSEAGTFTLGVNVSIAAGPTGRNAEAAGAASAKAVSGIFAYSDTKGIFAGASLEGSAIIERKDANEKLYKRRISTKELLSGSEPIPAEAAPLMAVLSSPVFTPGAAAVPKPDDPSAFYAGAPSSNAPQTYAKPTMADEDEQESGVVQGVPQEKQSSSTSKSNNSKDTAIATTTDTKDKPVEQATAMFNFVPDQPGDLGFRKGDIITIIQRSDSAEDWWLGRLQAADGTWSQGSFPSNYVKLITDVKSAAGS